MRQASTILAGTLAAAFVAATPSLAAPKIVEQVKYYEIGGKTGTDMLYDMNRKGPRHGFLTKAIAQTQFSSKILGEFRYDKGVCRVAGAGFELNITYVYPKPRTALAGDLARRWNAFQADNVRHEKMHGKIAREMAVEMDAMLRRFSVKDGSDCWRAGDALQRQVDIISDRHNKRQKEFDTAEHREGGPVEKSILLLVGKKR